MNPRARLEVMPQGVIFLLTTSLLLAALVASLAFAGNVASADDHGDGIAGLTYVTPEGVIYQHPTDGGDPVRLTDEDEIAGTFAWSPDGTRFSYDSRTDREGLPTLMVRDADGSNPVAVSEPFEEAFGNVARRYHSWSPDGSTILHWATGVEIVDRLPRCTDPGTFCGQRIWSAASDGSEPARIIGDLELDARAPVWTPDGESIIFAGSPSRGTDYGIYRMDADGANVERIGDLTGSGYAFDRLSISPDGTTLAVPSGDVPFDISLVDLATGEDVTIAGEEGDEFEPHWSPDGSKVAYTNAGSAFGDESDVLLYDVASGETISLGTSVWFGSWSPNGRFIVGDADGTLTVVDVSDPAAPVATEVETGAEAYLPSWQPSP